ncbi:hypothetical protein GCK32_007243 [Trichostrongylus colubriformis]|uniref:Galectin n=1 Tax=Trichostrongylus colubriformis TaxID=6319 RepID=A0AAN8IP49_TRICO
MHLIEFPAIPCTTPIYGGFNHGGVVDIHGELMQGPHNRTKSYCVTPVSLCCCHGLITFHVNGQHIAQFYHREDPQHVTALTLRGDVGVSKIHFEHFIGMNGGGIQIGAGVAVSSPSPVVVVAPRPAPVVEVVVPPRRPIVEVVVPRRPLFAPVVVLNAGGRHRRHH